MLDADSGDYEERNSRKQPLDDDEARQIVESVARVLVARGKKIEEIASPGTSLDRLKGPTGNYRAPIVRSGDTLLVGFHAGALIELVG